MPAGERWPNKGFPADAQSGADGNRRSAARADIWHADE